MPIFILVLPSRTTMKISARLPLALVYFCFVAAIGVSNSVHAGSATWDLNPASGDWNTAANWTPATVPNGSADTATFAVSNTTAISISANTTVDGITFAPGASSFTITASPFFALTITGVGITNNSGTTQNFVATRNFRFPEQIVFTNHATAGTSTIFTNNNGIGGFGGGITIFLDTSTAGNGTFINMSGTVSGPFQGGTEFKGSSTAGSATIINHGGTVSGFSPGGETNFFGTSTASNATITNNGATVSGAFGGETDFFQAPTAGSATIINYGGTVSGAFGGTTLFDGFEGSPTAGTATIINDGGTVSGAFGGITRFFIGAPTADSATLIANGGLGGGQGGTILFEDNSTGGTSRIEVFGNGKLDISLHNKRFHDILGVTVGSIEGDGNVFLGANNLTVGSNNLSTTFSGMIRDGGVNGGTGGSLTKIGTGTLELTGANTYTGNTNIKGGVLQIDGSITSNTLINHSSTLAGTGNIYGAVTGNGIVRPGDPIGTLTVNSYTQPVGSGRLLIDIAGTGAGEFSVLDVLDTANVNGFLKPVLQNGFIPSIGDQFTFLDYGSIFGAFRFQNPVFDNGVERWVVSYGATDAVLTATPNTPDEASTLLLLAVSLLGLVGLQANARRS